MDQLDVLCFQFNASSFLSLTCTSAGPFLSDLRGSFWILVAHQLCVLRIHPPVAGWSFHSQWSKSFALMQWTSIFSFEIRSSVSWLGKLSTPPGHEGILLCFLLEAFVLPFAFRAWLNQELILNDRWVGEGSEGVFPPSEGLVVPVPIF